MISDLFSITGFIIIFSKLAILSDRLFDVWQRAVVLKIYLCNHCLSSLSLNPAHVEMYLIHHYLIKFASDLQQVGGFLMFAPPIKLTATV